MNPCTRHGLFDSARYETSLFLQTKKRYSTVQLTPKPAWTPPTLRFRYKSASRNAISARLRWVMSTPVPRYPVKAPALS